MQRRSRDFEILFRILSVATQLIFSAVTVMLHSFDNLQNFANFTAIGEYDDQGQSGEFRLPNRHH